MWKVACFLIAGLLLAASGSAGADTPTGVWRLQSGKLTVRVTYCGGQNLCATIIGLAKPLDKTGKPKVDHENPNPSLRGRRVVGLQVVSGMKPAGTNQWRGRIYNADDGGNYRASASVSGNSLLITGCWGPICKKNRFNRVR